MAVILASPPARTDRPREGCLAYRLSSSLFAAVTAIAGVLCFAPQHLQAQTTQEKRNTSDVSISINEIDASEVNDSIDHSAEDGGATISPNSIRPGPTTSTATTRPVRMIDDLQVRNWWRSFIWAIVLVFVFVFGSLAIIVFSRRFRAFLTGRPQKPTSCDDVWRMHKLPPDANDDEPPPGTIDPNDTP